MNRETIKNIFNFLNEKEDKEIPQTVLNFIAKEKFIQELENHPDDVQYRYEGDLGLKNSNITKLPNDLYVDGLLNLRYCDQLTKLPDKLYVGGWLDIRGCNQLTELPNNLYVGGNLWLANAPLANNYTDDEIIEMITSKGGTIIGKIHR